MNLKIYLKETLKIFGQNVMTYTTEYEDYILKIEIERYETISVLSEPLGRKNVLTTSTETLKFEIRGPIAQVVRATDS